MAQAATRDASIQSKGVGQAIKGFLKYKPRMVKPQEVILFCRQLASFVRVGVPVTSAIQTFAPAAATESAFARSTQFPPGSVGSRKSIKALAGILTSISR